MSTCSNGRHYFRFTGTDPKMISPTVLYNFSQFTFHNIGVFFSRCVSASPILCRWKIVTWRSLKKMEKNLFWIVVVNAIVLEIWSLVTIFRNALGFVVHSCLFCVVGYNSMISLSIELIGNGILLWGIFKVAKLWLIRFSKNSDVLQYSKLLCSVRSIFSQARVVGRGYQDICTREETNPWLIANIKTCVPPAYTIMCHLSNISERTTRCQSM